MALYHFNLKQISRNNGQSVISSAAYRAGEKLYSSYYGEVSDYTRKSGVVLAEIHLPPHAPERFRDRETLWNELEWTEKNKGAQLAHSFEIAFMNEFSMEENIEMGRKFVEEQLVSRGMIADLCIHNPDKGKDADSNPHMHILVPIRPLNEDGTWGIKEKKVPVLDAEGNPVFDKRGKQKMAAVSTTGWSDKATLLEMRKAWADMNNELFAEKGFSARISEKSYAELGIDRIPTIHEGPNIRAMEKRGIKTTLGTINRLIRWINGMAERTKAILGWLVKEKELWEQNLEKQSRELPEPTLASYLQQYMEKRNKNAEGYKYGTQKAKAYNLKAFAESIAFLQENDLKTPADLEGKILDFQKEISGIQTSLSASQKKLKRTRQFIRDYENYEKLKPIQQTYNKKYFAKEAYRKKHSKELNQYQAVNRRLKAVLAEEGMASIEEIDMKQWEAEVKKEQKQVAHFSEEKKNLEEKLRPFEKVKACVDSVSTYHMVEEIEPVSVMDRLHEKQSEVARKSVSADRSSEEKERQDDDQSQSTQSGRPIRKKKSHDMEL